MARARPEPVPEPEPVAAEPTQVSEPTQVQEPVSQASSQAVATQQTPEQAQWESIRDTMKNYGIDLSKFQDDNSAVQHLAQTYHQAQQLQNLAQYGQEVLPHWSKFQEYLQSQQQQAKKQEEAKWGQKYWQAPEYNPNWQRMLERDEQGNYRVRPGYPPDVLSKLQTYAAFREEQENKLWSNPYEYFETPMRELVREEAQKLIQDHLQKYQSQDFAKDFVTQHSDWLYQRDAQQRPVVNPVTGQPELSQYGKSFLQYVGQAESYGIQNVEKQRDYAWNMLQRDYAVGMAQQNQQTQQAATAGEEGKKNFVARAATRHPSQRAPQNSKLGLREMLAQNLAQNGFNQSTVVDL